MLVRLDGTSEMLAHKTCTPLCRWDHLVLQTQSPSLPQYAPWSKGLCCSHWVLLSSVQPEVPTGVTKMIRLQGGGSDLPEEEQHSLLSEKC